jgi:hypothetical protein
MGCMRVEPIEGQVANLFCQQSVAHARCRIKWVCHRASHEQDGHEPRPCPIRYALSGSIHFGSSFFGLFTRSPIGNASIRSPGYGNALVRLRSSNCGQVSSSISSVAMFSLRYGEIARRVKCSDAISKGVKRFQGRGEGELGR